LASLIRTLELNHIDELASLQRIANFATLVATYQKGTLGGSQERLSLSDPVLTRRLRRADHELPLGFILILEPFDDRTPTISDPVFHLV